MRWVAGLVPLNEEHKRELARTFVGIVKSAVLGSGLIALAQGLLGGVAFSLVGLARCALGLGHGVHEPRARRRDRARSGSPPSLVLLLTGHTGGALFLLVWGVFVISGADNVIRLFVVKGPVRMHPLLIFFSVMGGIKLAGLLGVVYGPLVDRDGAGAARDLPRRVHGAPRGGRDRGGAVNGSASAGRTAGGTCP